MLANIVPIVNEVVREEEVEIKFKVLARFLLHAAKLAFTQFRQLFTQTLILYHFEAQHFIHIETKASKWTIGRKLA